MITLAAAPLAIHRAIAEVNALGDSPRLSVTNSLNSAAGEAPVTPVRARLLPPVVHYRVKPGDTVDSLAAQAGITADTVAQVNHLPSPPLLTPGDILLIPPIDGTMVSVDPTETLGIIARHYRMDASTLRAVNDLPLGDQLPTELFIPAMNTDALLDPNGTGDPNANPGGARQRVIRFGWPTTGVITQYFWQYHPGIDIANVIGTPEVAADAGTVVFAGWGSYGIYVEIDHGNGFHTIYGHMSKTVVRTGQVVAQGQLIGLMGETGWATGPHLHFEILFHDVPQNPLDLLS